jgi:prophage regulatory protein
MDFQKDERPLQTILRLTEVRQRTGLSRSTIYLRIEKGEFPRQVSLGARSVGWLQREVEDWINRRVQLRPGSSTEISEPSSEAPLPISDLMQNRGPKTERTSEPTSCAISLNGGSPDSAHLHLMGTKLYFDSSSGSFWLKLLPETSPQRGRPAKHRK